VKWLIQNSFQCRHNSILTKWCSSSTRGILTDGLILVAPAPPAAAPSVRQFEEDEGELKEDFIISEVQLEKRRNYYVKRSGAAQCGRGPPTVPAVRKPISGRISYPDTYTTSAAKKGAWPFIVSFIHLNLNHI
jgi:hypothetical protein